MTSDKTIFNLVATYNDYEKKFAQFLHKAQDVVGFASLGTTEQESGTKFRVDYIRLNEDGPSRDGRSWPLPVAKRRELQPTDR